MTVEIIDGVVVFDAEYWRRKALANKNRAQRRDEARAQKDAPQTRELRVRIATTASHVVMHFSLNLNFFGMNPEQAVRIGETIAEYGRQHPLYRQMVVQGLIKKRGNEDAESEKKNE